MMIVLGYILLFALCILLERRRREVKNMTKALENLNASIIALTTAVDAVLPIIGAPRASETEIQAAADAVNAQAARLAGTPPAS